MSEGLFCFPKVSRWVGYSVGEVLKKKRGSIKTASLGSIMAEAYKSLLSHLHWWLSMDS